MRSGILKKDTCYFVTNGGVLGSNIFLDDQDRARFLFLILHLQSPIRVYNISWYSNRFLKTGRFSLGQERLLEILKGRGVELLAFTILENHFEIIVNNLQDAILSVYMQRVLTSYGKYFNSKYGRKGHVFSGPFNATKIKSSDELLEFSSVIHNRQPVLVPANGATNYRWSSYSDYISENRWGEALQTRKILELFGDSKDYKKYIEKASLQAKKDTL